MYAIYVKTQKEPIYIEDNEKGALLQEKFEKGMLAPVLRIGDWSGHRDQVRSVIANAQREPGESTERAMDFQRDKYAEYRNKVDNEFRAARDRRLELPIEERAKIMTVVNTVWRAQAGKKPMPNELRDKIIKRQEEFLKENPGLTYANPTCYKDLIKKYDNSDGHTVWDNALLRLVEGVLMADKFAK